MRIDLLTLFPEMCETVLSESIIGRARKKGLLDIACHNIRDYTKSKHRRVDDYPYGGGMGMLLEAEAVYECFQAVCRAAGRAAPSDLSVAAGQDVYGAEGRGAVEAAVHRAAVRAL